MSTASDQINSALKLIGMLAEGETPSSETSQDCLDALNQMLDSWSVERLAVYATQDQSFTWPASTATRTLGSTGNFVGNRPVVLDDATYFRDATTGVSFGIKLINQQQYDGIPVKTVTSTYPQVLFANDKFPNMEMTLYPVPNRDLEFHFISVQELSQPASLATSLAFPPGYLRAFKYNLLCEIATMFGVEPPAQAQRIAISSKRNLKRVNNPNDVMAMPYAIMSVRPRFNIYSGSY